MQEELRNGDEVDASSASSAATALESATAVSDDAALMIGDNDGDGAESHNITRTGLGRVLGSRSNC